MKKRIFIYQCLISIFLTVVILLAVDFKLMAENIDMYDDLYGFEQLNINGHWGKNAIETCYKYGMMTGDVFNYFNPDTPINRAGFAAMINRAFGYDTLIVPELHGYTDIDSNKWYASDMKTAIGLKYLSGYNDGTAAPEANITREQAAVMLFNILRLKTEYNGIDKFTDIDNVSPWASNAVLTMKRYGYMVGYNNRFNPKNFITYAEAAQLLTNIIGTITDEDFNANGAAYENFTIRKPGVILKNAIISGNLYITEGVGDGDIVLDNVQINGCLLIAGGGENSISLNKVSVGELIIVDKPLVAGKQGIRLRLLQNDCSIFIIDGKVQELSISDNVNIVKNNNSAMMLKILDSKTMNSTEGKIEINVHSNAIVEKIMTFTPVVIFGNGNVGILEAYTEGVEISDKIKIKPENVKAEKGFRISLGGKIINGKGIFDIEQIVTSSSQTPKVPVISSPPSSGGGIGSGSGGGIESDDGSESGTGSVSGEGENDENGGSEIGGESGSGTDVESGGDTSGESELLPDYISFPEESLIKTYGDNTFTYNLSDTGEGTGLITYESSNPSVAIVDENANVTILNSGKTTITAIKESDGLYAQTEASYILTVNRKTVEITGFDIEKVYDGTDSVMGFGLPVFEGLVIGENTFVGMDNVTAVYTKTSVGDNIDIIINGDFYMAGGNADSNNYLINFPAGIKGKIKLANPSAPDAPTLNEKTLSAVTLNAPDNVNPLFAFEYACSLSNDSGDAALLYTWQDSPFFNDLTPDTTYYFFTRYKEDTSKNNVSPSSIGLAVTIDKSTESGGDTGGKSELLPDYISFPEESLIKTYGDNTFTYNLSDTGEGTGLITYESSNPSVAIVDENANVTILNSGKTTITAIKESYGLYTQTEASYILTVTPKTVEITGFDIEKVYDGTDSVMGFGLPVFEGLVIGENAFVGMDNVTAVYTKTFVGDDIDIIITGDFYMTGGNADSNNYLINFPAGIKGKIKSANPSAPDAPTLNEKTLSTVTLNAPDNANPLFALEYACSLSNDSGDAALLYIWQDSLFFSDLIPNTTYYFFTRYKEDISKNNVSPSCIGLAVTIDKSTESGGDTGGESELLPDYISFPEESLIKTYGDNTFTYNLSDTGEGTGLITYESSNPSVAIVDENAGVTILNSGKTTITAIKNSDEKYAQTEASYLLTVTPKTVEITGFDIEKDYDGTDSVMGFGLPVFEGLVIGENAFVGMDNVTAVYTKTSVGDDIDIIITGDFYMAGGNVDSNNYFINFPTGIKGKIKPANPSAPDAPTLNEKTLSTVTLNAPDNANFLFALEYACSLSNDSGDAALLYTWQDSSYFNDLIPDTTYYFFTRYKEDTSKNNVSPSSIGLAVTIDKSTESGNGETGGEPELLPDYISFPEESLIKTYGDNTFTYNLSNTGEGTGLITYESSNPSVAIVNENASVTILNSGKTTITAIKESDGLYAQTEASYILTVTPKTVEITGFDIEKVYDGTDSVMGFGLPVFEGLVSGENAFVGMDNVTAVYTKTSVGDDIDIIITGDFYMTGGNADSNNYFINFPAGIKGKIKPANPSAPDAPTLNEKTLSAVTLNAPDNANPLFALEYACSLSNDSGDTALLYTWQDSSYFNDLIPNTTYYFFTRYKEDTSKNNVSPSSIGLAVTIDKSTESGDGDTGGEIELLPNYISFPEESLIKTYGDNTFTYNLSDTGEGTGLITYESSNPSVAIVDENAGITILNSGKTTITAIKESDGLYAKIEASYILTVNRKTVEITGFDIEKDYDGTDSVMGFGLPVFKGLVSGENAFVGIDNITAVYAKTSVGDDIDIIINGDFYMTGGNADSNNYFINFPAGIKGKIKPANPSAPDAPTLNEKTLSAVTLNAPDNVNPLFAFEYACSLSNDSGDAALLYTWQDSPYFNDLIPDTTYYFFTRYKEDTSKNNVSPSSVGLAVTIDKSTESGGDTGGESELLPDYISFPEESLIKTYGDNTFTYNLSDTGEGTGLITYESSNPSVAIVDENANVTILNSGKTTITAIKNSDEKYAQTKASYLLTITPKTVEITGFDIEKDYDGTDSVMGFGLPVFEGLVSGENAFVGMDNVTAVYAKTSVGDDIDIIITGDFYMTGGNADSNNYLINFPAGIKGKIKLANPSAPDAPTLNEKTLSTVTLNAPDNANPLFALEYACSLSNDSGDTALLYTWQDSPFFSDLTPNTTYYFFTRYKEDITKNNVSLPSESLSVITDKPLQTGAPSFTSGIPIQYGTPILANEGTLSITAELIYKWFRSENGEFDDLEYLSTGQIYTPVQEDIGKYLVIIAESPYAEGEGMVVTTVVIPKILTISVGLPDRALIPFNSSDTQYGENAKVDIITTGLAGTDSVTLNIEKCDGLILPEFIETINETKTISIIYNGVTEMPFLNIDLPISISDTRYIIEGNPKVSVSIYDGLADDRAIPVTNANITAFNKYACDKNGLNRKYKLVENVTLPNLGTSKENWTAIGVDSITEKFCGSFDGQFFTISNLIIDKSKINHQGMFGCIGVGGTVKNLNLETVSVNGGHFTGGIAGQVYNDALVQNCNITGNITGRNSTGGIVGYNAGAIIKNCSVLGIVKGEYNVGGAVGKTDEIIKNCIISGEVIGNINVGGVVGENTSKIINCITASKVTSKSFYAGGIAGINSGVVQNCVALNSSVTAIDEANRIAYYFLFSIFTNNYAFNGMLINGSIIADPTSASNGVNGKDLTAEQVKNKDWWINPENWSSDGLWDFDKTWVWDDSGLYMPSLKGLNLMLPWIPHIVNN